MSRLWVLRFPSVVLLVISVTAGLIHGQSVEPRARTVAVVGSRSITESDLLAAAGNKLLALETQLYRARQSVLDNLVADALVEQAARERGLSVEELVRVEIDQKVKPVTADEVAAVLDSARDRLGGTSDADAMKSFRTSMEQSRRASRKADYVRELRRKYGVDYRLLAPRAEVHATASPAKGPNSAPVLITVFSDFECPFCARHASTMRDLLTRFNAQVRLEFRHFPLPSHRSAPKAAEAAACANEQGRFWQMHDVLFEHQKNLAVDELKGYAAELGLDTKAFSVCLDSGKYAERTREDKRDGEGLGVVATPATFINGRLVPGAVSLGEFVSVVEEELASASDVKRQSPGSGKK
jgi:protein-disulfide isomerase